jgi:hypothetical protein
MSYRQTRQNHEAADEAARQRGLAVLAAKAPTFAKFAEEVTREHALTLLKPDPTFKAPPIPEAKKGDAP